MAIEWFIVAAGCMLIAKHGNKIKEAILKEWEEEDKRREGPPKQAPVKEDVRKGSKGRSTHKD